MKSAPFWFIAIAIAYSICGMALGIWVGTSDQPGFIGFHAHLDLLGWATLAIVGVVYRAYPAMAASRLTAVHFWTANLGALLFLAGLLLVIAADNAVPVTAGAVILLLSQPIFFVNFLRHRKA